MMGVAAPSAEYPSDGDDLGRCLRLLDLIPEWKDRLKLMAGLSEYWHALVEHWDELAALHATGGRAVYDRMRKILEPIEDKDRRFFRMGKGASARFS